MRFLKRKLMRLYVRIVREKKPPEFIARGWALGMFVGCAVPFGFQLVISVPLSVPLKGSKIGAVMGTLITNPLTIFFIYPFQTWLADQLFLQGNLSYAELTNVEWTFETTVNLGTEVFTAFLMGGGLLALVLTPLTYFSVRALVRRHRLRVAARQKAGR